MSYGIFDTVDQCWMGNDAGPRLFDDETIARIAAQVVDRQLGQAPGRSRAKPYDQTGTKLKDEKATKRTPLQALRDIERGLL